MSEELESSVNAEPEVNVEPQDTEQTEQAEVQETSESVDEEVTPSQTEKPVQSQEDNAKYAAIRREAEAKAEARARDKMISEMYGQSHGIHTYSDYQKALEQQAEEQRKAELQEQGIDPSIVDQYINNNPTVKQAKELLKQQEQQQKQQKEYAEFLDYFRQENGRDFSPTTDTIDQEVWEMTAKGKSLTDAYTYSANKALKAKIAEYEAKLKAQETNEKNASSSPGSVTGNGEVKGDYVSFDVFEANKNDRDWVMRNYNKIVASRSKW